MQKIDQEVFLTSEGLGKLKEELTDLREHGRKDVAERIKVAKEFGDLSENADYHSAKEQQSFIEGRISELEEILKNAVIIESQKGGSTITVGSTVKVQIDGGEGVFTIVGSAEADPGQGKISNESPLGKALLNKKVGETVEVEAPAGTVVYTVKKIL